MTREQLIASLTGLDNTCFFPSSDTSGGYVDWSARDGDKILFEAGNNEDGVQVAMTREEVFSLQQRLTAWLLATE